MHKLSTAAVESSYRQAVHMYKFSRLEVVTMDAGTAYL